MINSKITDTLFSLQDVSYRDFNSGLIPNLPKEAIIGVRTPILRKYAKNLVSEGLSDGFMLSLPHKYFEENNLHAFIIQNIKDFDCCILKLEKFLPYIDNWATCDCLRPRCFKFNTCKLYPYVEKWISMDSPFIKRFAIGMLNSYYLGDAFDEKHLRLVSKVESGCEYYVDMMVAWYFASALSFKYDTAVEYLENRFLDKWIHNKTIQKAVESFRVPDDKKEYLKQLKI